MTEDDIAELVERVADLRTKRDRMKGYLELKADENDWHGVADAAMDLREIEAKIEVLSQLGK